MTLTGVVIPLLDSPLPWLAAMGASLYAGLAITNDSPEDESPTTHSPEKEAA